MPRSKPPPWARWLLLDARRELDSIRCELDRLQTGILTGDRDDETAVKIIGIRKKITVLRDEFQQLVPGPAVEKIVDWIMGDETILTLVVARLEGLPSDQESPNNGPHT